MIRPANVSDGLAIGKVYCYGWQAAYRGLMPDFFLNALTPENCFAQRSHIAPDRRFVAEVNGEVVGTATFGKPRDTVAEGLAELYSIYLLPQHWGTGQGSALFRAVVEKLKEQGYSGLYLWTLRDNTRARVFYEKAGLQLSGEERELEIAGAYLPEVQYQLKW